MLPGRYQLRYRLLSATRSIPVRLGFQSCALDRCSVASTFRGMQHRPMTTLQELLGIDLPVIQAPMASVQGSPLAIAVSNAGGLGSLPCALLDVDAVRAELGAIRAQTTKPFNVNFFCHRPPQADTDREATWRAALAPYFAEFGIDAGAIPAGPSRAPFSAGSGRRAGGLQARRGELSLRSARADLLARVRGWGAKILSSATTVDEARWLEARGVDAIIAQGIEAGGHRGSFLSDDLGIQLGTFALLPQVVRRGEGAR